MLTLSLPTVPKDVFVNSLYSFLLVVKKNLVWIVSVFVLTINQHIFIYNCWEKIYLDKQISSERVT